LAGLDLEVDAVDGAHPADGLAEHALPDRKPGTQALDAQQGLAHGSPSSSLSRATAWPALSGASPGRIFIGDTAGDPTILTAGGNQDDFGAAVAVDGNRLIVGAPGDSENGNDAGAVYFFFRDAPGSWHADGRVTASDAGDQREFGESVAYHASFLVGSPQEDAFLPGAAYLYSTVIFADGFETGDTSAWWCVTMSERPSPGR
jgi:hypothetical protein